MANITKSLVDKLEPQEDFYIVWDDKVSGFGVRVSPKGRKTYILKYRSEDGRQKKPRIGVHGNITCEEARKVAAKWHAKLVEGGDPSEDRSEARSSPTVSQLCDRFLEEHVKIHKKPGGVWLDNFYIEKYIKPRLGTLKTLTVNRQDIQKFHLSLADTPPQANRMLATLSKMFNLAEDWGLRPPHTNPAEGIQKYKENPRERYLSNEELVALGEVLQNAEIDGSETPHFVALIRLLLLTGARLREIMHARWDWVNRDAGLLLLPDSKTGKKVIHLSPAALDVLGGIERIKGNPYIIVGGVDKQPLISPKRPWKRVKEKTSISLLEGDEDYGALLSGLRDKLGKEPSYEEISKEAKRQKLVGAGEDIPQGIMDVRLHDLRHTYASICVSQGMTIQMVAKLLGHAQIRTSERYAHLAHDPVRNAAAMAGESIMGAIKRKAQ
ncbi:MAG: DUF4102 domain-containing protein [Verrucomicrobiae bacterium]|nr:DUF4102 domain-containing protein [Verrucomicrobiae bacterium]